MKHFRINNVHTNIVFFNLKRFLRKKNQFFYTSLNGIVFPSIVFTTRRQADRKNSCLGYECLVLTRQPLAFNSVDLGISGFIFQKLWAIVFWTKFSKFDDIIQKYDDIIKILSLKFCPFIIT